MTNYDLLVFLATKKSYYSCQGHFRLLQKTFPKENVTMKDVRSMRSSMASSPLIETRSKIVNGLKVFRVLSVDPQYQNYARERGREKAPRSFDSYLASEPAPVVRSILLMQQFDKLLRGCNGHRNGKRPAQCGQAMPV